MYTVYVIQHIPSGNIYVGQTTNLRQRILAHNTNRNLSTKRRVGKWILVYAEIYLAQEDALRRESKLKQHGSSKRELLKRITKSLLEIKSEAGA